MSEEFLKLPFFRERGFALKKCKLCEKPFWTLDSERERCGDQPCVDYEFMGCRVGRLVERPREVRELFLNFFERESHARVGRYPVVARWREDVYLVGASIYDFQPWVTEGLVDPPANPLAISQPSIRLTDLDNVGKTGRHLTGFEMMAHHAFNIRGRSVYWANETVEYAHRVLTEAFGIPEEEITYKFDWWSGGGNAGEDYEVLVKGLEVATLVFMHYKVKGERVVPIENKIVDTGYGLERILWLLRGEPTVYDTAFHDVLERLRARVGLEEVDPKVALTVARKSGRLDFKYPQASLEALKGIAAELGVSLSELMRILEPYHSLYALVDHTRSIMWMVGDGVVPSNVGAGYLARLLIRRALRHLWRLRVEEPLSELVALQMKYWSGDFPEYLEVEGEILDIVGYEEERFHETLKHGRRAVERALRDLMARSLSEVPINTLLELYESHGVSPELVAEEAAKLGLSVSVPADFYSSLASRHEALERKAVPIDEESLKIAEELPPTERLYYKDSKMLVFEARVLKVSGNAVALDKTAFYPEGGGQPCDTGVLEWDGSSCRVIRVEEVGGVTIHFYEGSPPPVGALVRGRVDASRRYALMCNHTATHALLGAARRALGRHVWQAGAQKGVDQSRLDITHHKKITSEEVRAIEELANRVVMENRAVNVFFEDRTAAEMKYGFVLYQGGVVPEPRLRVVEIEKWDVEACGGLHCSKTGEIGLVKVVKVERIQDGVSRLVFKVGDAALRHVWQVEEELERAAQALSTDAFKVSDAVLELLRERREVERELQALRGRILELAAKELAERAEEVVGVKLVAAVVEESEVRELALKVASLTKGVVGLVNASGNYAIKVDDSLVKRGLDARVLNAELMKLVRGKGGGVPDLVSGRVEEPLSFPLALRRVVAEKLA